MKLLHLITLAIMFAFTSAQASNDISCPRIISQSPYISDMLDFLDMGQCIVGVSRYSKRNLPHTGGILDPDAEAINSLMPDLFITSDWTKLETLSKIIPSDAQFIRLKSFNKMAQLEENMKAIIDKTGWTHSADKVKQFSQSWRKKLDKINGNNKQVLLLSSCSGLPYSFGPNSRLYDLFTQAGFKVVETGRKIRHIRPGNEIADLTELLNRYQPDLLFVFEQKLKKQCQVLFPKKAVKILNFDGKDFLHPTVKILNGLDNLIRKQHLWQ